jgi:hypothetical protein
MDSTRLLNARLIDRRHTLLIPPLSGIPYTYTYIVRASAYIRLVGWSAAYSVKFVPTQPAQTWLLHERIFGWLRLRSRRHR